MHILCVDDERPILELMVEFLQLMQHTVVSVEDGQRALEVISEDPDGFDLLITDERMPLVSGLELAKRLRDQGCMVPVILISGHNDEEMQQRAQRYGVVDVLAKPFSLASLNAVLAKLSG